MALCDDRRTYWVNIPFTAYQVGNFSNPTHRQRQQQPSILVNTEGTTYCISVGSIMTSCSSFIIQPRHRTTNDSYRLRRAIVDVHSDKLAAPMQLQQPLGQSACMASTHGHILIYHITNGPAKLDTYT